jgi:hypothetical protein
VSAAPVFVVGAGRSGSTLVHQFLAAHPELCWLPGRVLEDHPERVRLAHAVMRCLDVPLLGRTLRRVLPPGEVYPFWERLVPGFTEPGRDLTAVDAVPDECAALARAFAALATPRRARVLAKVTGWPRIGFLHRAFPAARFVHVARDPRAVAHSFLGVSWWRGREGPEHWRWGPLSAQERELWEQHDRTPLALACLQMRIYWRALAAARRAVLDGPAGLVHDLRYEELCARPVLMLRGALASCGLSNSQSFEEHMRRTPVKSADDRWQRAFSASERGVAEALLEPCLEQYEQLPRGL